MEELKMVSWGKPVYYNKEDKMSYDIIRPEQVKACEDGAIVGNMFLSDNVLENIADKVIKYAVDSEIKENGYATDGPGVEKALTVPVEDIKYIPPFPENCPIDPKHHATGPAMDLTGEIKNVDVYRKADDEDIAVVPNGIIHDGEFISISQIGEAAMVGAGLCKLFKQETGNILKESF